MSKSTDIAFLDQIIADPLNPELCRQVGIEIVSVPASTPEPPANDPTWLSSHRFLADFWPGQSLDPATLVRFRHPGQYDGWLEAIQARMTVERAIDDSTPEIVRCLSQCVCGELLVNLAVYLRDAGYDILNEEET